MKSVCLLSSENRPWSAGICFALGLRGSAERRLTTSALEIFSAPGDDVLFASAGTLGFCLGLRFCHRRSILPKIFETIGRHFGVSNRVHDVPVAHVVLERSGIVPVVELIAGRMPQHVRMNWEREFCGFSCSGDHFQEARRRRRTTALGDEDGMWEVHGSELSR